MLAVAACGDDYQEMKPDAGGSLDTSPPRDVVPLPDAQVMAPDTNVTDIPVCPTVATLEGDYSGTFDGTISSTFGTASVTGTESFSLARAGTLEFVTIKTGDMSGKADNKYVFKATLTGKVTCDKLLAQADGKVTVEGLDFPFNVTMKATHSGTSFPGGTWSGTGGFGVFTGSGTWNAAKQ